MGGFLAVPVQGYNVGNGKGMSREVLRVADVEALKDSFKGFVLAKLPRIDKHIICRVNGKPRRL